MDNHTTNSNYTYPREVYGVEQSNYGHCYRWIFEKSEISKHITEFDENECNSIDCGFPIGGSNSSSTYIVKLNDLDEINDFLLDDYKTDIENPTLIDIAEGVCTISTDDNSITSFFVKLFNIDDEDLTRDNYYWDIALKMVKTIEKFDTLKNSGIDYEDAFYGKSKYMRLSELEALFKKVLSNCPADIKSLGFSDEELEKVGCVYLIDDEEEMEV